MIDICFLKTQHLLFKCSRKNKEKKHDGNRHRGADSKRPSILIIQQHPWKKNSHTKQSFTWSKLFPAWTLITWTIYILGSGLWSCAHAAQLQTHRRKPPHKHRGEMEWEVGLGGFLGHKKKNSRSWNERKERICVGCLGGGREGGAGYERGCRGLQCA